MPDIAEIASWYDADEDFCATPVMSKPNVVALNSLETDSIETFADALIKFAAEHSSQAQPTDDSLT